MQNENYKKLFNKSLNGEGIQKEMQVQLKDFETNNKLLEAQRLRMRTEHDLEMMEEMAFSVIVCLFFSLIEAFLILPSHLSSKKTFTKRCSFFSSSRIRSTKFGCSSIRSSSIC